MTAADEEVVTRFGPLFAPSTVAVVGASTSGIGRQNVFIRRIRELGYSGAIYPIHPTAAQIDGLAAYRTLADTPEAIDYAFVGIAAASVPDLLAGAAGRVRFAQVISSGFAETQDGSDLQNQLLGAARAGGMRLLGPNCLGLYSPRGRITFTETKAQQLGTVGIVSQSGGLGTDIVRRGSSRGLKFSGVVTLGNCADLRSSDLLEFFLADSQTKVIGLYIESAGDGRKLFEILRAAKAKKPVIILKGGRTSEGSAAASSHTGSLSGEYRSWIALSRQTGCLLVNTLNEFLDVLLTFQLLTPRTRIEEDRSSGVVLFGNGGGTSVLATDYFAGVGLHVLPFDNSVRQAMATLQLPPGVSLANPVDCPAGALEQENGAIAERILDAIYKFGRPEILVMHLNLTPFVGRAKPRVLENLIKAVLRVRSRYAGLAHFVLVLRSDGEARLESRKRTFRRRAVKAGIPVFDELSDAGLALKALCTHERFVRRRAAEADSAQRAINL